MTFHPPLTHGFPVTSQLSHLPSQSEILHLLYHCLQSHQEMVGRLFAPLSRLSVSSSQVKRQLGRLNQNKAASPDGVSSRILKACVEQPHGIFQHLYNLTLSQERVPVLWRKSCLVPVPKKKKPLLQPSALKDYRPGALTNHIIKILERFLSAHLSKGTTTFQDPQQFAYHRGVEVKDAIIHLLQQTHSHLDKALRESCSLISLMHLTPSNLHYHARNSRMTQVDVSTIA